MQGGDLPAGPGDVVDDLYLLHFAKSDQALLMLFSNQTLQVPPFLFPAAPPAWGRPPDARGMSLMASDVPPFYHQAGGAMGAGTVTAAAASHTPSPLPAGQLLPRPHQAGAALRGPRARPDLRGRGAPQRRLPAGGPGRGGLHAGTAGPHGVCPCPAPAPLGPSTAPEPALP